MDKFGLQRQYYPVLAYRTFLNTAQSGLLPTYAAEAICADIQGRVQNAMDIVSTNERWADADSLRYRIAEMLHCDSTEIAFGANSSTLFNIFSNGINLKPGDNVITYDSAYFAMPYTWINKRQDGIDTRIATAKEGRVDISELISLADEKTRAISVCHVDFASGYKHDLVELGAYCRNNGIFLAVDATQTCGVLEIDVEKMNIDFLTTSCYKWLQCVWGLGIVYIRRSLLDVIKQESMGWSCTKDKNRNTPLVLDLSENANRFEYGGLNFPALAGLRCTIEAYLRLGPKDIEDYVLSLTDYVYERTKANKKLSIFGNFEPRFRSHIVTFQFPENWLITREYLLDNCIVAMPLGPGCCRIGIHYYNNKDDIDRLFNLFEKLEKTY